MRPNTHIEVSSVIQTRTARRPGLPTSAGYRISKILSSCLVALAVLLTTPSLTEAAKKSKPNFIYINIDDLGYADIEPFGSKVNRTPHLNRMAEEGRKLTCFYAAPVCSPSRASLMTGSYPKRALSIPHVLFPGNAEGLDQSEVTVAELLKAQGYSTGIIGKWHLGDQPEFLPRKHGFDYYYGLPYSNDMGPAADGVKSNLGSPLPNPRNVRRQQPPLPLLRNETVLQRVLPDDQQAIVENYTNEAVSFIWDHRDEPFFLYLPHSAVHFPLYPGKKFHGKSKHGLFGDWVEEVDWSVGQVLDTVRQLGLAENTMVIFTSDNGGQNRHGAINLPLRGGKGSTFEGGMRVPTIAWWPTKIPAGTASDEIVSTMDILPTLTNLAGGKSPTDRKLDGHDIWPILAGSKDAKSQYEAFYFFRGFNLQCVRSGDWKLHLANGELYNLKDDISEAHNVAKDHPEVVAKLEAIAESQKNDLGVKDIGPGCRPLGKVNNPQPLIGHDGKVRAGFEQSAVHAGQGIMIGEVTDSSAIIQVRLTKSERMVDGDLPGAAGIVRFQVEMIEQNASTNRDPQQPVPMQMRRVRSGDLPTTVDRDFIARQLFRLVPDAEYRVQSWIGTSKDDLRDGPTATFRTLPGKDSNSATRFVVVTGMNYGKFHGDGRIDPKIHLQNNNTKLPQPYSGPDKHLGYPALASMLKLKPHFFVGTGDNIYYDTPKKPRAETVPQMRQKWHEQFVQPRYRQFFAKVPTYWMIDDHDYRIDDGDNSGDYLPSAETGLRIMLEQLPYGPAAEGSKTKTYRTHRVNKDLQVWFTENRRYRSDNAMEDGPDKTIWGAEQKAWLKKTLAASDATFKLMISPTPMVGPDDKRKFDNHTNFNGFRHERDEFFAWLNETGIAKQNFYLVCGDRHWQYHALHPSGIEEFSCGALVDPNSRLGRSPGDPQSTDPDGLIKQLYTQKERSGGFLMIESSPAKANSPSTLSFDFHDENGEVLHSHSKQGK
jgi:arylsulfatase A-like enzyme/phosphodiesterase/alkaline phosphatase D-like protein